MSPSTRFTSSICIVALLSGGCATRGLIDAPPAVCMAVGAVVGAAAGAVIRNQTGGDADDRAGAAVLGGATGGGLGLLLCGAREKLSPTVRASAEPMSGPAPLVVQLRSTASDADGSVVSYAWDFGDGRTGTGAAATHTYLDSGNYEARVTVTDNDGRTGSAAVSVRVTSPPPPVQPVVRRIVLRGVNFDFDKDNIRPDAQVILDTAVEVLGANPGVRVEVAGHTDSTGPGDYNQGLSERRARSVVRYLASGGIDASRLTAAGFGEMRPVADNATREGRAQNRRVELNIR